MYKRQAENNPNEPPDANKVLDLGVNLPGTLVAMRFEFDNRHLSKQPKVTYSYRDNDTN